MTVLPKKVNRVRLKWNKRNRNIVECHSYQWPKRGPVSRLASEGESSCLECDTFVRTFKFNQFNSKLPWNDLAADADGLVPRKGEKGAIDGNSFPLDFVRPAGIVTQALDTQPKVGDEGSTVGLPVIQCLQALNPCVHRCDVCLQNNDQCKLEGISYYGEINTVAFHQVGQAVEQVATLGGIHCPPWGAKLESLLGRLNSFVDITLQYTDRNDNPV